MCWRRKVESTKELFVLKLFLNSWIDSSHHPSQESLAPSTVESLMPSLRFSHVLLKSPDWSSWKPSRLLVYDPKAIFWKTPFWSLVPVSLLPQARFPSAEDGLHFGHRDLKTPSHLYSLIFTPQMLPTSTNLSALSRTSFLLRNWTPLCLVGLLKVGDIPYQVVILFFISQLCASCPQVNK